MVAVYSEYLDYASTLDSLTSEHRFVDVIVETSPGKIILIERASAPFGFALPGGFVDHGEALVDAAVREVQEETGLSLERCAPLSIYQFVDEGGQSRGVTSVFTALGSGLLVAADDAKSAIEVALSDLPVLIPEHECILKDYRDFLVAGQTFKGVRIIRSSYPCEVAASALAGH